MTIIQGRKRHPKDKIVHWKPNRRHKWYRIDITISLCSGETADSLQKRVYCRNGEVSIFTIYWFSIQLCWTLDIRVHQIPLRCFGMAKGRSKHQNNTLYLSPEEKDLNFNSETEKCLNTPSQSRKARSVFLCTLSILIAFVIGLIIGFFTKTGSCKNNKADIGQHGDHSVNLQTLLFAFDKEEVKINLR